MYLTQPRLTNFRCYDDVSIEDIPNLLFLVGDNDVGKTVVIDAIETLIEGKAFAATDFRECDGKPTTEASITARFSLLESDEVPPELRTGEGDSEFEVSVTAQNDGTRAYEVVGKGYSEEWMDNMGHTATQGGIGAAEEKARLTALGETEVKNAAEREAARGRLLEAGTISLVPRKRPVPFKDLSPLLPRLERTSAESFTNPATLILTGLKAVAREITSPADDAGKAALDDRLRGVQTEIESALNDHVRSAQKRLRTLIPGLKAVTIDPTVTFDHVVAGVRVVIDKGEGPREIGELGQGTNRRAWMALQEWQREANRDTTANGIYLFDEPDTALHYGSQQRIYDMLQDRARAEGAQCVVCTHSIHLIDRAPADSICLIERPDASRRTVRRILPTPGEGDVRGFLADIGRSLGLTNTALLYEKAFLLVEGASEENALPFYYRTLYGRSMAEDGIHVINLYTCGAWKAALDIVFKNRREYVHLLLDGDCKRPNSSARLTPERIREAGGEGFLRDRVTFVGDKELEDAWPTPPILRTLDEHYPRRDQAPWSAAHVEPFRQAEKPSKHLQSLINGHSSPGSRGHASKPEIASRIAAASTREEVPSAVAEALNAVRQYAGL